MSGLRIATVNTQAGRVLRGPDGLRIFAQEPVDILLLQEVFGVEESEVARRLQSQGYRLIILDRPTGLAMALHTQSRLTFIENSAKITVFRKRSGAVELMTKRGIIPEHHVRARGLITVALQTPSGIAITVATTHPTVFIRHWSRTKHLRLLHHHLQGGYTASQPLLLGADMNHYPQVGRYDIAFRQSAQFSEVPIRGITWPIEGTKYELLARAAARLSQRPIDTYSGHLDTILYRGVGVKHIETKIVAVESDHRAIISHFSIE